MARKVKAVKLARFTKAELQVLLDAANLYETEPANFEDDPDTKRLDALHSAIEKLRSK